MYRKFSRGEDRIKDTIIKELRDENRELRYALTEIRDRAKLLGLRKFVDFINMKILKLTKVPGEE